AKLLLGYVLGKIPEPVNPDTVDQEEVRMYSQNLSVSELHAAQNVSPPRVSLAVLRATSMIREENARGILFPDQETPSTNGPNGASSPSTNGGNGASPRKRKPSPLWRQGLTGKQTKHDKAG